MMARVLHLIKTVHGAAWALRQVREVRRAGVAVTVALPSAHDGIAPRYRDWGADVVEADLDFTSRQPWRLAQAMRRCRQLVDEIRPALIHSHFVSTTLTARRARGRHHPVPRAFQGPRPRPQAHTHLAD